ncbi:MAG: isoprenylcysteine carboxyl methyltransferase [Acidimicrobiaceae bacterium]|nr:isoprenylcysteine carboxyl methyltransferase [Acidimicrobiaceae bacterium]
MLRLSGRRGSGRLGLAGSSHQPIGHPKPPCSILRCWLEREFQSARAQRLVRISANLVGAVGASLFAIDSLQFYLKTHLLIGATFLVEQTWVVIAYLIRRSAHTVSRRLGDWSLAFGGTFGAALFRPVGAHPHWGVDAGLWLQLLGLAICVWSFLALGRSFGFAAADRGLVRRGPYAVVRHPIYASYVLLQTGYVVQSISVWNALVMLFATSCNVGRALVEDRVLATNEHYDAYRNRVRWRLLPGVW